MLCLVMVSLVCSGIDHQRMAPHSAQPLARFMPRKKATTRPSWYSRKRPPTIARALMHNKLYLLGTGSKCVEELKRTQGVSVSVSTFFNWVDGGSTPSGVMRLSECGAYIQKSIRCRVNDWAGIDHESWWRIMIDKKCLKPIDKPSDPFKALGLRPPNEA